MKQWLSNRLQPMIPLQRVIIGCIVCLNLVQIAKPAKSEDQFVATPGNHRTLLANSSTNTEPNVTVESFSDDWNRTRDIDPNINILESKDFKNPDLNNQDANSSPIWRPFYRQITLEDFNKYDCCARALKSTTWELQDRCEDIGFKLWKVGAIKFSPLTEPVEVINICYILEKKAVGNNWFYQCTTKAEAKCFDPKLPENTAYMNKYNEIERLKESLIIESMELRSVDPNELTYESVLELIPTRPKKTIPDNLTLPIVRPNIPKSTSR